MNTTSTRAATQLPPGGGTSLKVNVSTQSQGTDFLSLLTQSQARTAPAEGHKSKTEKDNTPRETRRDDRVHSERPHRRDAERARRTDERQPVACEAKPETAPTEQPAAQAPTADTNQTAEQNAAGGQGNANPQGQQPTAQQPQAIVTNGEATVALTAQVNPLPLVEGTSALVDAAVVAATNVTAGVTAQAGTAVTTGAALTAAAAATTGTPVNGEAAAATATATVNADATATLAVDSTVAKAIDAVVAAATTTTTAVTDTAANATVSATVTADAQVATPAAAKADTPAQAPTTTTQQPQAAPAADASQAGTGQQGQPQGDAPKQQFGNGTQQPQAAAAVAATVQADAETSSNSTATTQAAPANPVQPFGGVAAGAAATLRRSESRATPVHISNAAEAVENTIKIASQRGVTHAKLALKPAELGGVEIRLLQTAAGLTAKVSADSPEAAKLLQQAGDDLRSQLEAAGVTLQSLDISYSGSGDGTQSSAQAFAELRRDAAGHRSQGGRGENGTGSTDTDPTDTVQPSTLELPDGVLVDVLA